MPRGVYDRTKRIKEKKPTGPTAWTLGVDVPAEGLDSLILQAQLGELFEVIIAVLDAQAKADIAQGLMQRRVNEFLKELPNQRPFAPPQPTEEESASGIETESA